MINKRLDFFSNEFYTFTGLRFYGELGFPEPWFLSDGKGECNLHISAVW